MTDDIHGDNIPAANRVLIVADSEFFLDQHNKVYAVVLVNGRREIHPIKSHLYKILLATRYYELVEKPVSNEAIKNALNVLEGRTYYGENTEKIELHNRVAWDKYDNLWYDLTNDNWTVVRINEKGWKEVGYLDFEPHETLVDDFNKKFPTLFRRYNHQKSQVSASTKDNDINLIWKYVNIKAEDERLLFVCSLISKFIPEIPHAIDIIHGSPGATKSTCSKIIKEIVDPSILQIQSLPKLRDNLTQAIDHHWIPNFDNVGYLSNEFADVICRATTGEGTTVRELYSDDTDFIRSYTRPIVLNGVTIPTTRQDVIDRAITFELSRPEKKDFKTEEEFWKGFNEDKPRILGAIFDILSKAMKTRKNLKVDMLPRMADFGLWGEAISRAMGEEKNVFVTTFFRTQKNQTLEAIQNDLVGMCIYRFVVGEEGEIKEYEGTTAKLLNDLEGIAESLKIDIKKQKSGWPKAPNSLSRKISSLATAFKEEGIIIEKSTATTGKDKGSIIVEIYGRDSRGIRDKVEITQQIPLPKSTEPNIIVKQESRDSRDNLQSLRKKNKDKEGKKNTSTISTPLLSTASKEPKASRDKPKKPKINTSTISTSMIERHKIILQIINDQKKGATIETLKDWGNIRGLTEDKVEAGIKLLEREGSIYKIYDGKTQLWQTDIKSNGYGGEL